MRQPFTLSEVGLYKAQVLVNRLNVFWGLDWCAVPTHVRCGRDVPDCDFLITCVDTRAARATLAKVTRLQTIIELTPAADLPDGIQGELAEASELLAAVEAMREQNPMLGMRGCRLGLLIPDIVKMQTRAILAAAARVAGEGKTPLPEIMIPLVGHVNELKETRKVLEAEVASIVEQSGQQVDYKFGTMIEVPR